MCVCVLVFFLQFLLGMIRPPVHEYRESDHEERNSIENDAKYERSDVQLLRVVRVLFGPSVLLFGAESFGTTRQEERQAAEQWTTAAENAQPRPDERRVRTVRRGRIAAKAAVVERNETLVHRPATSSASQPPPPAPTTQPRRRLTSTTVTVTSTAHTRIVVFVVVVIGRKRR